jgi:sortase A
MDKYEVLKHCFGHSRFRQGQEELVDAVLSGRDALGIMPGEDYCTLVTCTPYGINTHRLLVRGHRVENTPEAARMHVTADATQFDPLLVAPVLAIPVLLLLLMILLVPKRRRKSREDKNDT